MLWRNLENKGYVRDILVRYTGIDAFIAWKTDEYILYCHPEDFTNASAKLRELAVQRDNLFDDIAARCYALCKDYLDFCLAHRYGQFEEYSDEDLRNIFVDYVSKNVAIVAFRPLILMLDNLIAAFINEEITRFPNVGFRYELIIPKKDLPFMAEAKDVLRIGSAMEEMGITDTENLPQEIELLISEHLEKYGWVLTHRYLGEPMSRDDVISNLKQCLGTCTGKVSAMLKERRTKEDTLAQIKGLSSRLRYLIETSQEYAYLRTFRMDAAIEGDFYLRSFFFEVAKRVGLEYDELVYLTTDEIVGLLSHELSSETVRIVSEKRHVYFATFLVNDNQIYNFEGAEYRDKLSKYEFPDQTVISGKVAQRGRIAGKVKVVRFKEEIGKINEGDIIVSPMTTPEMIGGIMKCAGIVTDEGGIASHAAQISREFKIPCIIGTNSASYVLKDGDTVEIVADGLDGTVTRIKSVIENGKETAMKILVIENDDLDYEDIKSCLPSNSEHQHKKNISECLDKCQNIVDELKTQCELLISDIIKDLDVTLDPYSSDALDYLREGLENIDKVHNGLGVRLIIITKMPVKALEEHFEKLKDNTSILHLFSNNIDDLLKQLKENSSDSFKLYSKGDVRLLTKPYDKDRKNIADINLWKAELTALLEEIRRGEV
jgi:phosphohistidine swiveling domain-containing protein